MDEKKMSEERGFEIGKDESWFGNIKRTYDEYQNLSLDSTKDQRSYIEKLRNDIEEHNSAIRSLTTQAMQNAIETANMISKSVVGTFNMIEKQALRTNDFSLDRQWNIDEVSDLSAKTGIQADTIQAIATAVTAEILKNLSKTTTPT